MHMYMYMYIHVEVEICVCICIYTCNVYIYGSRPDRGATREVTRDARYAYVCMWIYVCAYV